MYVHSHAPTPNHVKTYGAAARLFMHMYVHSVRTLTHTHTQPNKDIWSGCSHIHTYVCTLSMYTHTHTHPNTQRSTEWLLAYSYICMYTHTHTQTHKDVRSGCSRR